MSQQELVKNNIPESIDLALEVLEKKREAHPEDVYFMWFTVVFNMFKAIYLESTDINKATTENRSETKVITMNDIRKSIAALQNDTIVKLSWSAIKNLLLLLGWGLNFIIAATALYRICTKP